MPVDGAGVDVDEEVTVRIPAEILDNDENRAALDLRDAVDLFERRVGQVDELHLGDVGHRLDDGDLFLEHRWRLAPAQHVHDVVAVRREIPSEMVDDNGVDRDDVDPGAVTTGSGRGGTGGCDQGRPADGTDHQRAPTGEHLLDRTERAGLRSAGLYEGGCHERLHRRRSHRRRSSRYDDRGRVGARRRGFG